MSIRETQYSSESFRDVSIQNWNYYSFKDFFAKLDATVDRHAPLKKLTPREIDGEQTMAKC